MCNFYKLSLNILSELWEAFEAVFDGRVENVAFFNWLANSFEVVKTLLVLFQSSGLTGSVKPVNNFADVLKQGGAGVVIGVLFVVAVFLKVVSEFVGVSFERVAGLFPVEELAVFDVELVF